VLRKQRKMEKIDVALDSLLEIERSPVDKFGLGFQRGESNLHVGKNNKEEPNKPVAKITSSKSGPMKEEA